MTTTPAAPGGMLGRGVELDAVAAFVSRVAAGPAALLLEGPAGIGSAVETLCRSAGLRADRITEVIEA
ncbi:MAG TPA: hypothetical protein VIF84_02340 [Candidatus Limnocylindrales bacterium]|jgi:hypothetical protein